MTPLVLCILTIAAIGSVAEALRYARAKHRRFEHHNHILFVIADRTKKREFERLCVHYGWTDPFHRLLPPRRIDRLQPVSYRIMGEAYHRLLCEQVMKNLPIQPCLYRIAEALACALDQEERDEFLQTSEESWIFRTLEYYVHRELGRIVPHDHQVRSHNRLAQA